MIKNDFIWGVENPFQHLEDLKYTNNGHLISQIPRHSQENIKANASGLENNIFKTNAQYINFNNPTVECVDTFKYLDSMVTVKKGALFDMHQTIYKYCLTFWVSETKSLLLRRSVNWDC